MRTSGIECMANAQSTAASPSTQAQFTQFDYPSTLYESEVKQHREVLEEYEEDVSATMDRLAEESRPNLELFNQQPYLTYSIRAKLIDFIYKMSVRLKIIPFVFYRAVRLFDRYCSKRIVLLDQAQLIITTCLWISAKVQGGNNHFVNMGNLDKIGSIRTINDLGYGSGGKYLGPTERFRLPKLHELVKLCGAKCRYDQGMFKQMELHVLQTLDWSFTEPSIEEYICDSTEFNLLRPSDLFKVKEYMSYISLFSAELIDVNLIELGQVILDLINETFDLSEDDKHFQSMSKVVSMNINRYKSIKKSLIKAILTSGDFVSKHFNFQGPQYLRTQIVLTYIGPKEDTTSVSSNGPPLSRPPVPAARRSPASRINIPPAHHISQSYIPYKSESSPIAIYKPVACESPMPQSYKLPSIITNQSAMKNHHQHNNSQASLNSSISRDHDIFEYESRRNALSTPLSDTDSPLLMKFPSGSQ